MERTCLSSTSYRFWIGMRHREFGDQRLKPFVVLLRWFMNSFCFVVGRIILLKTHHCHQETLFPWKGVNGLQRYLGRWYVAVWVVDGDQYGHPDRSAAVQQTLMLCVFWLLSIRVNKLFFSSFSYSSSSVRLDHWGQSAFAVHQRGLPAHDPVTGSPLFLSCPLGPRSKPAAWKWYAFLDNMNTILRKSLRFDWAWCFWRLWMWGEGF